MTFLRQHIDGQAKKQYSGISTVELAKKGLFRAAYSYAIWSKDPKELETVAEIYNRRQILLYRLESLRRLFGVFPVETDRSIIF